MASQTVMVSPRSFSRGYNGKWTFDAALAARCCDARRHRAGGALCARRLCRGQAVACGFWDHWVPGANDTLTRLCKEWGDKEKVDVAIDYITSQGDKNLLTIAAEAQSHSGDDILAFRPGMLLAMPTISNRSTRSSAT